MPGLYEELAIPQDASQDQIRKAYKKRALQTHPDRLAPGATPEEKAVAEENFRKVNNAYEVLSDPNKRSAYDRHGVWPPADEDSFPPSPMSSGSYRTFPRSRQPARSQTYPDPFSVHLPPLSSFHFTDPFTLFNSIFEDSPFQSSLPRHRHNSHAHPTNPFGRMNRMRADIETFMDDIDRDPFGFGGFPAFGSRPPMTAIDTSFNNRGSWASESYMSSTVNGVTQTIRKRVDSDGNEHITRTLPDGRQVRTINGVEQSSSNYYPHASKSRRLPEPSGRRYYTPDSSHSLPMANTSRMDYNMPHSPFYNPHPLGYRETSLPADGHRRPRRSSEQYPTPAINADYSSHEERHRKKRWWP